MSRDRLGDGYHFMARVWLTAALLSFLLPAPSRVGIWVPLHLAVVGAVSVAISGAMQTFAAALTAAPDAPRAARWTQFVLVNVGAVLVVSGVSAHRSPLIAIGATLFTIAMVLLAAVVVRHMRRGLNPRHRRIFAFYFAALGSIVAGAVLGALLGTGAVTQQVWVGLRQVHAVTNVLGWAALTIVGTLVTFLPTTMRVRMVEWSPVPAAASLSGGLALLALGLGTRVPMAAAAGATLYAAGAVAVAVMVVRTLGVRRRRPVTVTPKHLIAAAAWFVGSTIWLAVGGVATALNGSMPAPVGEPFLVAFVAGFIVQTLLGAWLHLLPMQAGGEPDDRRRMLAGADLAANVQVGALNLGLVLLLLGGWGEVDVLGRAGWTLALIGAVMAITKAWAYRLLAGLSAARRRADVLWTS